MEQVLDLLDPSVVLFLSDEFARDGAFKPMTCFKERPARVIQEQDAFFEEISAITLCNICADAIRRIRQLLSQPISLEIFPLDHLLPNLIRERRSDPVDA